MVINVFPNPRIKNMAFYTNKQGVIFLKSLLIALFSVNSFIRIAFCADPDILFDFLVPSGNYNDINGSFFTHSEMRDPFTGKSPPPDNFTVTKATMKEFPALEGQSISYQLLQFPVGSVNVPHSHPRGSELLFLISGCIVVGFVDRKNKLFKQTLEAGDMFMIPKGLVHFSFNKRCNSKNNVAAATAFSAFGTANPGRITASTTLFTSGIDSEILAQAFKTDVATIQELKAGLAGT